MADRLSQLQFKFIELAEHMCNAMGVIQQISHNQCQSNGSVPPVSTGQAALTDASRDQGSAGPTLGMPASSTEDVAAVFAQLIARTSREIDTLIDALPSEELTSDLQLIELVNANAEGMGAAQKLVQVTEKGDELLDRIQNLLHLSSVAILETRKLEAKFKNPEIE